MTIKGDSDLGRAAETEEFIKEIKSDNHTYERFEDVEVLQEREMSSRIFMMSLKAEKKNRRKVHILVICLSRD